MVHSCASTKFSAISPDCRHLVMAFALLFPCLSNGQGFELPTQQQGALDAAVWTAGIIAQHDSTTSFDTGVWLSGARFGGGQQTPVSGPTAVSNSAAGSQPSQTPGPEQKVLAATAIRGTPGMFTVESAEVLPKGAVSASAYTNKFSVAPGSVNIVSGGFTVSGGLFKKITVFGRFEPYIHADVDEPSQLSLNFPAGCPHDVYEAPIYCAVPTPPNPNPAHPLPPQSSWKGPAAAYVPGYPFLAHSTSGYGPLDLGFKVNFWSETRKDPLSVSLRTDFYIPTASAASELANNGVQTGAFDYSFALGLSKTFRKRILVATNVTYVVTGHPKANGVILLTPGDQIIFGQGFIFPIRRSLEFVTEYTGTFYQEGRAFGLVGLDTENTTNGPTEPVDGVWGVRWSFREGTTFDLGYRYMLNLHQVHDRGGFILQISNLFRKPKPG